jgi:hypothetical protein
MIATLAFTMNPHFFQKNKKYRASTFKNVPHVSIPNVYTRSIQSGDKFKVPNLVKEMLPRIYLKTNTSQYMVTSALKVVNR